MKKLLLIAALGLVMLAGCSGDSGVYRVELKDFIGDWYMEGTMDLSLDGRPYTQEISREIFIRDGMVTDEFGDIYTATYSNQTLVLKRANVFNGSDPYCGVFDGGTQITFTFPFINPYFDQAYTGQVEGDTAIFTQYCYYKPLVISGTVIMQRF